MKTDQALELLEQVLKLSITGYNFSEDGYNKERYHSIREKAEQLYEELFAIERKQIEPIDPVGYITPKIGVNGVLQNAKGEVLLEKRMDDKSWGIPGGWAEVGLTGEENIIREFKEETGLDVKVVKLLEVFCRKPTARYLHTSYHILYKCELVGGTIEVSHESEDIKWRKLTEIETWHEDHKIWLQKTGYISLI